MTDCIDHGCKGYGLGYATAWIKLPDGTKIPTTKHRRAHYENTGELPEVVMHTCDNPRCINPDHLVSGTQVDNMQDCKTKGRARTGVLAGEYSPCAKLTDVQCNEIRSIYIKGSREFGLPALARKYGVGTSQLHRIIKGARTSSYKGVKEINSA